jgi:hypothetical protein
MRRAILRALASSTSLWHAQNSGRPRPPFHSLPRQFFLSLLLVNVAQSVMKRGAFRMQFYGDFEQGQRVILFLKPET